MTKSIIEKLDHLANMQAQRDVFAIKHQEMRDMVIPQEVKDKLAEIDAEFAEPAETINQAIATLEAEIKADVETTGESIKGEFLHAIYTSGRVTWDAKILEGYSVAHPELLTARKVGKPSVSIRGVK